MNGAMKMAKEQLLQELAAAFEQAIVVAREASQRGLARQGDAWGPRETLAHMAGWEIMATVRIPHIAAGMAPLEFEDETQQTVMDDAINATIVAMIGEQSLDEVCATLRRAYQSDVEMLKKLDKSFFQPGEYVYERTKGTIEHCQEHMEEFVSARS